VFCPGTAYLPDGRIVITGGSNSERVTIYDNGVWRRGEDMKLARGYHSSTVTVDGGIFSMGGSWNEKTGEPAQDDMNSFVWWIRYGIFKWFFDIFFPWLIWKRKDGEIWDPQTETWRLMKGVKCEGTMVTNDSLGQYRK
jgi:galactose oxidase